MGGLLKFFVYLLPFKSDLVDISKCAKLYIDQLRRFCLPENSMCSSVSEAFHTIVLSAAALTRAHMQEQDIAQ
jgi:hypothetical protein